MDDLYVFWKCILPRLSTAQLEILDELSSTIPIKKSSNSNAYIHCSNIVRSDQVNRLFFSFFLSQHDVRAMRCSYETFFFFLLDLKPVWAQSVLFIVCILEHKCLLKWICTTWNGMSSIWEKYAAWCRWLCQNSRLPKGLLKWNKHWNVWWWPDMLTR